MRTGLKALPEGSANFRKESMTSVKALANEIVEWQAGKARASLHIDSNPDARVRLSFINEMGVG